MCTYICGENNMRKNKKITNKRKASKEVRRKEKNWIGKREKEKREDGKRGGAGSLCEPKVSNLRSVLRQL